MDDVSPGVPSGAFSWVRFEVNPLRQHDAERVVDPSHSVRGLAIRDDMTHHGFHWLEHFNIEAASGFPWLAFAPVEVAINVANSFQRRQFEKTSQASFLLVLVVTQY